MTTEEAGKLWGGRFKDLASPELMAISRSVHFDWRLARYDLLQTMVHASALLDAGVISASEYDALKKEIHIISAGISAGEITYQDQDEDVHSAIERIITNALPDVGSKIRAGRSRNDQVATDLRLYLRAENQELIKLVLKLIEALLAQATAHVDTPTPGFTHLQHAQPVTLGHELAKHAHALLRDSDRAIEIDTRIAISPLGSGALAGSNFSLDVEKLAGLLDFNSAAGNSLDAVSDRDYAVELIFNFAMIGMHLSRLAEEIILYTTTEFGFAKLHDSWSTGSSLMPQKKNPDIAELTRGKTGRLIGNLVSIFTMLKALPFAYNRDLQEDKEAIFDSIDQLKLILPAMTGLITTLMFDEEKLALSANTGHAAATDVADYLVRKGVPFKEAHQLTGALVLLAEANGVDISDLEYSHFQSKSGFFEPDIVELLKTSAVISARSSKLGTASLSVSRQIQQLHQQVDRIRNWTTNQLVQLP